ncbi:MAG TPA: cobalamin biosynthesis protein CobT, partial [Motiliproteus sp.]
LLAAPRLDGWRFGEEEGRIDARRLARLVTSPTERRLFRQEQLRPHTDAQVCLLIDNSGSMKQQIESITLLVDLLCRAFEQAGARSEVLGYTTGGWNGGRPFKQWQGRGAPANPGRLNELCHIVYKDAEHSWRRSRPEIATLLKTSLFRESIDGEALLWARRRLQASRASRKILLVISDGCPHESMTCQHNPPDFLDRHLHQVAELIERGGEIELAALGVGLDLSRYYRRSLALDLSHSLDNRVFDEVVALLARRPA